MSKRNLQTLHLDTIDRSVLDFDFEQVCSVTNTITNVYACLVCGKYFQGRGPKSIAFKHSILTDHHVFIHLQNSIVYILPDNYNVDDPSLSDIINVLNPKYRPDMELGDVCYDLNNKPFIPGCVGLNNIKHNDYQNVVFLALSHVVPLRNAFLYDQAPLNSELVIRLSALVKKLWNPHAFKGQVSPQELVQEVSNASKKRFSVAVRMDPIQFVSWLLNTVHTSMKKDSLIMHSLFQGQLSIESQQIVRLQAGDAVFDRSREIISKATPFLFLTLDLPQAPLFQDALEKNMIPQVALNKLLSKYNGETIQESDGHIKRLKITSLPRYTILHCKRFTRTKTGAIETNPTIVNFEMSVDFASILNLPLPSSQGSSDDQGGMYRLVANICCNTASGGDNNMYKVFVYHSTRHKWFEINDLYVREVVYEMISLESSYIQIWERQDSKIAKEV